MRVNLVHPFKLSAHDGRLRSFELVGWTTRSYDPYVVCHDPWGVVLASLLVKLGR